MRSDMAKVVTEAPRGGSSAPSLKTGRRLAKDEWEADDHGPSRHPVSRFRQFGWDAKTLSDVLGPLRRYLRTQVGRPWDVVYSDLSRTLDRRSVAGLHIWDHIRGEVETGCTRIGNTIFAPCHRGYRHSRWPVFGLYVHPVTGLLCYREGRAFPKWRPAVKTDVLVLSPTDKLQRIAGVWYRLHARTITYTYPSMVGTNTVIKTATKVVIDKKQLNKKELQSYQLKNLSDAGMHT